MSTQKSATNKDPPVQRLDRSVSLAGPHQHNVQPLSLSTDLPRLRTYTAQSGTHPSELLEAYREQINSNEAKKGKLASSSSPQLKPKSRVAVDLTTSLDSSKLSTRKHEVSEMKRLQRNQIYALNQLMTHLEHENFVEFCRENNLDVN